MLKPSQLSPAARAELLKALEDVKKAVPSLFTGLNICQRRAFKAMYSKSKTTGLRPHVTLVTPANGVGKTYMMVLDMVGWCKGPMFLKKDAWPAEALDFYASLKSLRNRNLLSLRLCCDAEDVKEGGSVLLTIKEVIPDATFSAMDTNKCYRQINIPHPTIPRQFVTISVRTYNQEVRKLSGSNCHRIWANEPMPQEQWGETIARTRSKKGNVQGSLAMFATVLDQAPYVSDLIDNPRNVHVRGHCWENCVGEEVTDAMAVEVRETTGTVLPRNPQGPGYLTHGVLTRQSIEDIYANMECGPEEMAARKSGNFMHLEGLVFKELNPDVHLVDASIYEEGPATRWPVVQVVDPHDRHPDFSAWFLILPSNRAVCVAEHPIFTGRQYFESMRNRRLDIIDTCKAWRALEEARGFTGRVVARLGDPNKFLNPNPRNNQILLWDYAQEGFNFNVTIADDISLGHNRLHTAFKYDAAAWEASPNDAGNVPRMQFSREYCHNVWRSLIRYGWKENKDSTAAPSERLNQKFKGPVDVCRYFQVWFVQHAFRDLLPDAVKFTDAQHVKLSRLPLRERECILYDRDEPVSPRGKRRHSGVAMALGSRRR